MNHKTIKWNNRIVSTRVMVDMDTGESLPVRQLIKDVPDDVNWQYVWIKNLCFAYDIIGDKKVRIFSYLLENMDSENKVISSTSSISKHLEISRPTVQGTINKLIEYKIIKRLPEFGFQVDPDITFDRLKGDRHGIKRIDVLHSFIGKKHTPKTNYVGDK